MQVADYQNPTDFNAHATSLPAQGRWREVAISTFVGLGMVWYYQWLLLDLQILTDVQGHIDYLLGVLNQGLSWPANPGFHWVTWLLSGQNSDGRMLHVATWTLGLCWGITTYLTIWVGQQFVRAERGAALVSERRAWADATIAILAALAAGLVFPAPANTFVANSFSHYTGLLPPNVYHNSTLIGSMPFAIAALGLALRQLRGHNSFWADALLGLLLAVGALFKPSFAFAFLPAYGLCRLFHGRRHLLRHMGGMLLVSVPVVLVILGQTWWIAHHPEVSMGGKSTFAFALPAGWKMFLPELTAGEAFMLGLSSFALPLLAYALRPAWLAKPAHQLLLLGTVIATLQFMLVYESGYRAGHGNFTWQVIAINHWLYWVVLLDALQWQARTKSERIKQVVLVTAIAMSVVSGIVYASEIGLTGSYV
jgi:hypothetical protein